MSRYRVVYYSLFLPRTQVTEDVFSGKDVFDRRVERIKRRCHCNIRTTGNESMVWKGGCYMMVEIVYDKDVGNHTGCMYMIQNLFKTMRKFAASSFKIIPHQCVVRDRKGLYHTIGFQGQKEQAILKALVASSAQNTMEDNFRDLRSALQQLHSPDFYTTASYRSSYQERKKHKMRSNKKTISKATGKNQGDALPYPQKSNFLFKSRDLDFSDDETSISQNLSLDRTSNACDGDLSMDGSISISQCFQNIVSIHSSRSSNISSSRRHKKPYLWQRKPVASTSSSTAYYSKKRFSRCKRSLIQDRNISNKNMFSQMRLKTDPPNDRRDQRTSPKMGYLKQYAIPTISIDSDSDSRDVSLDLAPGVSLALSDTEKNKESIKIRANPYDSEVERSRDNIINEVCHKEIKGFIKGLTQFFYPSSGSMSDLRSNKKVNWSSTPQLSDENCFLSQFILSDLWNVDPNMTSSSQLEQVDTFGREIQLISDGLINEVCMENAYSLLIGLSRFYVRCKKVLPNVPDKTLIKEILLILDEESKYEESIRSRTLSPTDSLSSTRRVAEMMGLLVPIDNAITAIEPIVFRLLYDDLINYVTLIELKSFTLIPQAIEEVIDILYSDVIEVEAEIRSDMGANFISETALMEVELNLFDWILGSAVIDVTTLILDKWDKRTAGIVALAHEQLQNQLFKWIYQCQLGVESGSRVCVDAQEENIINTAMGDLERRISDMIYGLIVENIAETMAKSKFTLAIDKVESSLIDSIYEISVEIEAGRIYRKNSKAITKAVREIEIELSSWVYHSKSSVSDISDSSMKIVKVISCAIKLVEMEVSEWMMKNATEKTIMYKMDYDDLSSISSKRPTFSSNSADTNYSDVMHIDLVRRDGYQKTAHNITQSNGYTECSSSDHDIDSDEKMQNKRTSSSLETATIDKPIVGGRSSKKSSINDDGKRCSFILRRSKILKELLNEIFDESLEGIERRLIIDERLMRNSKKSSKTYMDKPQKSIVKLEENKSDTEKTFLKRSNALCDMVEVETSVPGTPLYEAKEVSEGLMRYVTISAVRKIVAEVLTHRKGIYGYSKVRQSMLHLLGDSTVYTPLSKIEETSIESNDCEYEDLVKRVNTTKES